jgi:hypothetical protein
VKIENTTLRLPANRQTGWLESVAATLPDAIGHGASPLRFSIVGTSPEEITVEATIVRFEESDRYASALQRTSLLAARRTHPRSGPFGVVQVVPTGIRCEFGGYAGDACPATNLLASTADFLVTHPNAVNASELNEMAPNVLYVEGSCLDDFLLGRVGLFPVASNKIGTFVDPTGEEYLDYVLNTINAARAAGGIDCDLYTVLTTELGVRIDWSSSGCAVGTVLHPEAILDAVAALIAEGAQAIGGVSVIHGVTSEMFARHLAGDAPNPSGGVEAIITHLISKVFRVPTAHAPLPYYQDRKKKVTTNPRAAAEFISTPHYFCVLKGLAKAPRIEVLSGLDTVPSALLSLNNIGAIILPATCLGGLPALAAQYNRVPVIAVSENTTILNMTNERMRMNNVIEVSSYLEAAGAVLALREGISLESLRRPIGGARRISPVKGLTA